MRRKAYAWKSSLALPMQSFLREKRALGYSYKTEEGTLNNFDRQLAELKHRGTDLSRSTILALIRKRPNEQNSARSRRMNVLNEFLRYLLRNGHKVELIPPRYFPVYRRSFKARIFTAEEVVLFLHEADHFPDNPRFPLLPHELSLLFHILVNAGLRLSEALLLKIKDVDIEQGILRIVQGKNQSTRLVPLSDDMTKRVRQYAQTCLLGAEPNGYFFPGTKHAHLLSGAIRTYFLQVLRKAHIPYRGKNGGPRLHDLRHTFSVHCLNRWIREGADLLVVLPILSKYLGHLDLRGTQRYLQLTAEMYPDISQKLETAFGGIIPERTCDESH